MSVRDRELFAYALPDHGLSPFPPFVNISQGRTEQLLDEQISEEPLIEVRWGQEVDRVAPDEDGVTVGCASGLVVRADYAVACTGLRSARIRAGLGIDFTGRPAYVLNRRAGPGLLESYHDERHAATGSTCWHGPPTIQPPAPR